MNDSATSSPEPSLFSFCVLTVNGGSSSIKFALFDSVDPPARRLAGEIKRIGAPDAGFRVKRDGQADETRKITAATFDEAVVELIEWLQSTGALEQVSAIGHRVVHGGSLHTEPVVITELILSDLRAAIPLAPSHLPTEIQLIEALTERLPEIPQVACFDTAFHRELPPVAQNLPIPRRYREIGIRRYGFHGLSYSFLLAELERLAGERASRGKVIFAHLGSGASMAAVQGGRSIDTTMGLTPAGGLMMSSRTGDIDPGVLVFLARSEGLSADQIEELVTSRSGLLGVSGVSADMQHLLSIRETDEHAAEAVAMFCYQARKCIGSYAAALGGLDTVIFSGGIGENAPEVRAEICVGLEFLGIRIDPSANKKNAPIISEPDSVTTVRVIATDEEMMIARLVFQLTNI